MKSLIFIVLMSLSLSQCNNVNNNSVDNSKINQNSSGNLNKNWKVSTFEPGGLTIDIPSEFVEEVTETSPHKSPVNKMSWVTYDKTFKESDESAVHIKVINNDTEVIDDDGKVYTPEELQEKSFEASQKQKAKNNLRPEMQYKEVEYLELDGVKGHFIYAIMGINGIDSHMLVWTTYRYFKGKPQMITISCEFKRLQTATDNSAQLVEQMKKIIGSIKLAK